MPPRPEKDATAPQSLGLWADTWRRLRRNKLALVGLGIIIVFMLVGLSQIIGSLAAHSAHAL